MKPFFDPGRLDAFTERLAAEGLVAEGLAGDDTVTLPTDRLSGAELRLWFIEQLEPGTATYVMAAGLRLRGPLDVAALGRAATVVVGRHEALRCRFPAVDGIPAAHVDEPAPVGIAVEDVAADPHGWAQAQARIPFDLASGPLIRLSLGRIADDDHLLVVAIHHIVVDGEGLDVVLAELLQVYAGESVPPTVDGRHVRELTQARIDTELAFWRTELAGLPDEVALVRDRPPPAIASHRGGRLTIDLGAELHDAVVDRARRLGSTPAVVHHAAFRCLLALLAAADDVAIGCAVNLREPEQAEAVGNYVNALAIRSRVTGDATVADVVGTVGAALRRALAHRRVGFDRVVQELAPERTLSRSPLFQVSFAHHTSPLTVNSTVGGLVVEPLEADTGTTTYDLALEIAEWRDTVRAHLSYRADLYDESTARRLLDAYRRVLAAGVADPGTRLSELPLLDPADESVVLAYARIRAEPPADEYGLAGRVAAAVTRDPDATAVIAGDEAVSYRALQARSVEFAAALDRLDLDAEAPVAVLLPRGPDLVAAMLACARVGHPFVPLDQEHPPERLARVIATARAGALIATTDSAARLPGPVPPLLDPDRVHGGDSPLRTVHPDQALYTIFTSGSTGAPKGVVVSHGNLLALIDATREPYAFDATDVWACSASSAFDFSVWEIWPALTTGARVVLLDRGLVRDPAHLLDALGETGVTMLSQTPSGFRSLQTQLVAQRQPPPPALRAVFFGAEALYPAELRGYAELTTAGGPRLVNMYGITETTVHVTATDVDPHTAGTASPIGVPLPHLSTLVLDGRLRPVPVGVPGELYVGGLGVARGYAHQPGLTASRFVPDPYRPGGRLYRTGDRVRWAADGTLEYLGRTDDQLKVRGFRVEPAEVESALVALDGVRGAGATLRDGRLVAFVVGDVDPAAARVELARTLPHHLVPSRIEVVDELPMTPNGKLDRRALPALGSRPGSRRGGPAATPAERVLADAYRDLLGADSPGTGDDFFSLGGDSILAVQLAARAAAAGLGVTVADVFANPVLGELAARAAPATPAEPATPAFGLVTAADRALLPPAVEDAYPLASVQAGMLFRQLVADSSHPYHIVTSYELRGSFDEALFRSAVDRVYARYAVLRTSIDLDTYSEPLQLVWPPAPVPLVVHDLRDRDRADQERAVNAWMARESRTPLPLTDAPLLRPHVHVAGPDRFWLSFVECHAVIDGWSLHVVIRELIGAYQALLAGADVQFAAEPVRYAEHVAAERAALADDEAAGFFRERIRGASRGELHVLAGPVPAGHEGDARRLIVLPAEAQRRLEQRTRETGVPLKSMLMGLHVAVVGTLLGVDDVVTATSFNGRPERPGAEDSCGMYLNRLPFRLGIGRRTWRELATAAFAEESAIWRHRRFPAAAIRDDDGERFLAPPTIFLYNRFRPLAAVRDGAAAGDGAARDGAARGGAARAGAVDVVGNPREIGVDDAAFVSHWDHEASEPSEHLALTIQVRADLAASLDLIAQVYRQFIKALVDDVDGTVARVEPADETTVAAVARLNAPPPRAGGDPLVHRLIERVAREHPDAVAVRTAERTLTYRELDQAADRLMWTLRRDGVGPGDRVCLAIRRDWRLPVAVLAVLKAGAAFVPIDPADPADRRQAIVAAARTGAVVDDDRLDVLLAEAPLAEPPAPLPDLPPEAPCYVIFTSGSSGAPKGVVVPHRGIGTFLRTVQDRHPLTSSDAVLFKANTGFDASLRELLWPLVAGAAIVVAPPGAERDPGRLVDLIATYQVTVCHFVPSMLREFVAAVGRESVAAAPPERLAGVRLVCVGGEALPIDLARTWCDRFAGQLVNVYGPTEASVDVTSQPVDPGAVADAPGEQRSVPIGTRLPYTRLHVLNPELAVVPFGLPGELYLGGPQLADGYLGAPGATAARFVPDPYGPPGARMYRTGDRVLMRADGVVEFLGRVDHQLKIRGHRIEPGEVEAALLAVPGITGAAAVERDGRLIGYVTGTVTGLDVRRALAARLPEQLVPAYIVGLDRLPRTPSGKVDRRALPAPDLERVDTVEYVAPRDRIEEILATAYCEVLGLDRVGVYDNFYELGGDSIRSLRVVGRALAAGLRIEPTHIFEHQTIAAIAPHCALPDDPTVDTGVSAGSAGGAAGADPDGAAPPGDDRDEPDLSLTGLDQQTATGLLDQVREAWR